MSGPSHTLIEGFIAGQEPQEEDPGLKGSSESITHSNAATFKPWKSIDVDVVCGRFGKL